MTRIAVLADIHANLPALEAVVDDIARQAADEILVGGDLVGRGPQGSAVIERIWELGWPSVRGNHEDYLVNFFHQHVPEEWLEREEWAASRWMAAELTREHVDYIDALPFSLRAESAPGLHLFHGSPRSNQEGIGTWTEDELLEQFAGDIEGDALACAHTHRPLMRRVEGTLFTNVGSVGLPFNGDWRAQYVIFTHDEGGWEVEFRQVPYDRDALLAVYDSSGFLAEGGVTSALLRREVLTARPFLVPFMKWAEFTDREPAMAELDAFLDFYDPHLPMKEMLQRLLDLRGEGE